MKKLILLPFVALFALGSCEEIIIEKIYEKGDSIPYPVYVDRPTFVQTSKETECVQTDTLDVSIEIGEIEQNGVFTKDTLMHLNLACYALIKIRGYTLVPKDSVLVPGDSIPYPVPGPTQYDTAWQTVYDRTVIYIDTLFVPGYVRPTWDVPLDLMPHLEEFSNLAAQYGQPAEIGMLIIHYTDDLPGEGWVSSSFKMGDNDQWVIFLDERLPAELHRASMLRELGRLSLNKKYSNDQNKIMSPLWRYDREITQQDLDNLFL